jgi:predicted Zn-dependent protease
VDSAERNDAREAAGGFQAVAALREVEFGNWQQGKNMADAAMQPAAPNRDVQAMVALAQARAADTAKADNLAAALDNAFPLDTLVQKYWLPTIRAAVALQQNRPKDAIEVLRATEGIELGQPIRTEINTFLYPVYLRGEAYLMLNDGNAAAAEFQKYIDHRGVVGNNPLGALARLGLARACVKQGDTAKARAAYQEFLTIWKDADPNIPIYQQAKAESAKLN